MRCEVARGSWLKNVFPLGQTVYIPVILAVRVRVALSLGGWAAGPTCNLIQKNAFTSHYSGGRAAIGLHVGECAG